MDETTLYDRAIETQVAAKTLLDKLRLLKPNDRSTTDRHWAVAITEAEKLAAYIQTYLVQGGEIRE